MIMGGKTLKKRKTVANKKTANPVYNEAFVFTLLPSYLDRVSFMLSVFTVTRLGGSKKLIGRAVVGPYMYSTDQGLSHWNDMINSPRNPVAQWHTLIWKKRFHKIEAKEIYFRNTNKGRTTVTDQWAEWGQQDLESVWISKNLYNAK